MDLQKGSANVASEFKGSLGFKTKPKQNADVGGISTNITAQKENLLSWFYIQASYSLMKHVLKAEDPYVEGNLVGEIKFKREQQVVH